jgi:hypothetical protein
MTSAINPNNIDGAYPVAGQDNDSQGFRDNFTNTKTNFQYAAAEITDLQNKAVLKAALTGTTLNNDMAGSILSNAQLQDMSETRVSLGTVSGEQTINYAAGPYYTLTANGSISLAFTNIPAAGVLARFRVQITINDTTHTLTLPTSVTVGRTGVQGLNISTNVITFGATGTYEFEFETNNGLAGPYTIFDLNRPLVAGYTNPVTFGSTIALNSAEDLAASAAANLSLTTSYFTTSTSETATLAAGTAGQVKVFAMNGDGGDMVITVTNAAWGGAGTITFSAVGQACTLMYINSKWFCIGNNGAAFA